MAHNINVPIAFEFRPLRASWGAVAAQITGWAPLKSPESNRCFLARVEEGGTPYLLEVPWRGLPNLALALIREKSDKLPDFRSYSAELLVCHPSPSREGTEKRREADPWNIREEFLRLQQNTKTLVAFLKKWGVWGTTRTLSGCRERSHTPPPRRTSLERPLPAFDPEKMPNIFALGLEDRPAGTYILPSDIWEFQRLCRVGLTKPAQEWLTRFQKYLLLTPQRQYPHWLLSANTCQEAIRDTITIDLLKKVTFRLCARPDCRSPFPVESQHQREYCRQYCAHIESVRRKRKEAQEALQLAKGVTNAKR